MRSSRLVVFVAAALLAFPASAVAQRVLVASSGNHRVLSYDANSGAFLGALVPAGSGGLSGPREIARGPDGLLYVASLGNDTILRYDATTGAFVDVFVTSGSGGLDAPWAINWAPGGDLLVTESADDCVLRFHQTSGAYVGTYLCDGGMASMQGLVMAPNDHAFVSDFTLDKVREYDASGVLVRTYVETGSFAPRGLAFGPNGNLFVTSALGNKVLEFDTTSGALLGDFVTAGSGGLSGPQDLAFRQNGNLLVASSGTNSVLEYTANGAFLRVFVAPGSGGLSTPCGLLIDGGFPGDGPPMAADYGDAPDDIESCQGTPSCVPIASYPTLFDTGSAPADRTAPFHLPIPPNQDCWFGGPRSDEPDAFQPCCDWVSEFSGGAPADLDDGPLVLCLDAGCASGVFVLMDGDGRSAAIGCFGPPPPAPETGFWIYSAGLGATADPAVNRFINIAVDVNLSGSYGDAALEWPTQDQLLTAAPGASEILISPPFPVLTVVPCGGPLGWCVGPFWTRFHVSPEPMVAAFPGGDWDGSSGAPDGYPWGETEDWVVYCDPQSSGGSCGSSGGYSDCNGNGRPDFVDVVFGSSSDWNANDIPDECESNYDWCNNPFPLCGYGPFPFDTSNASTGSEGQSSSLCFQFGTPAIERDHWYVWTAPESGTATLSTCGQTQVDTKIAVYAGNGCPSGDPLACVDDACGFQTELSWTAAAGSTYTIQLGQFPGASAGIGTFDIRLDTGVDAISFCSPGTGGVIPCPCSNPPASAGRGCNNSANTGGASLSAAGAASLSNDTLVFTTAGERPTALSIVMQGPTKSFTGLTFGQGVRCATGSIKRLYVKSASGGSITAPQPGDPSVSARSAALGNFIQPGEHRYYGVYYRDPVVLGGCPPSSSFNITQSLDVTWAQ